MLRPLSNLLPGLPIGPEGIHRQGIFCHDHTNDVLETFLNFNVILLFLILAFCVFKRTLPGGLVYISFDDSWQDTAGVLVPPRARWLEMACLQRMFAGVRDGEGCRRGRKLVPGV